MSYNNPIDAMMINVLNKIVDQERKNVEYLIEIKSDIDALNIKLSDLESKISTNISHNKETSEQYLNDIRDSVSSLSKRVETVEEKEFRKEVYLKLKDFMGWKKLLGIFFSFVVSLSVIVGAVATLVYKLPNIIKTNESQVDKNNNNSK